MNIFTAEHLILVLRVNKYLKFDALLKKALAMGIDYVATGHYAKIEKGEDGKYILRASEAVKKDQSYVLYNFTQEQLAHTLMPLGGYNKDWVRQKAEELGLGVAHKLTVRKYALLKMMIMRNL